MSRLSAIQKKMWSRHSLAWSWPPSKWHELRTGSSFLQAPSVLSKEFHHGAWTNTFPSGESLRRWGESGRHREDRPFFRRNPAGCRIIDSKNHKTVPNINSCDHRGLIRYWSECSHRHRSQKFIYIMNYCSHEERSQNQKKTFKSIPNIHWKL